ncbi:MAG: PSD1 and planctomycete cytochrome C domain-containing protein, partial [Bryobacteraceae bacterium]
SPLYLRISAVQVAQRMPPAGLPLGPAKVALIKKWIDSGAAGLMLPVDFAKDVEPIFKASCYNCHSGTQPKARLRLDAKAGAMAGGLSGPVIVPGKASASRLIHRVEGTGNEKQMPLGGTPLTPKQIATLRRWIDGGASWPGGEVSSAEPVIQKHWAYRKPVRPAVPAVNIPFKNPIDAFIEAKLEEKKLTLRPEASREKLIRRVSLDLTGLPASPSEINEFVADTRPDAYERLVDRLLASPHFGERWARPWLDLARYADTNGYEKDDRRTMWKYRDWVIEALNKDLPFDQFTIEQIAGDMLPNATEAQKIATGFNRNTMLNEEGGVDKDEAHFEVMVDRVNTTATVWLGSTIGCSQCHNHKYDPFLQREYYSMMAFFNNTSREAVYYGDTSWKWWEAKLDLPTPEQDKKRQALKAKQKEIEARLKTATPELDRLQTEWERAVQAAGSDWQALKPARLEAVSGTQLALQGDGSVLASGENPLRETFLLEGSTNLHKLSGVRIEALPDASLPHGGPGRDVYGNFIISEVKVEVGDGKTWQPVEWKRYLSDDGRTNLQREKLIWRVDASNDEKRLPRQFVLVPPAPVELQGKKLVRLSIRQDSDLLGQALGRFRVSLTDAADPSLVVKARAKLRTVMALPAEKREKADKEELAKFYLSIAPSLEADRDELKEIKNQLDKLDIVTALVMQEQPGFDRPFDYVRTRGGFSAKADKVYANVPASLGSLPEDAMPNRLGLARWLASKDNPLTARVAINRIWEQYFGRGIVETSEDFGSQGQPPTHPELLDWLAVEFMDRGWSPKAMHKLIVTSAAYKQDSTVTPDLLQVDPYNRLISRGPRFRLEAEMVRDVALAASGFLSDKIGGPSVFPYQTPGVWDVPYSDDKWVDSKGADRYRRGLYTFIRRSALYPSMMNFDATSREYCTVRRIRTDTPIQALTALNDPAFVELAQGLAARIDMYGIDAGFRLVTGRKPKPAELDRMQTYLKAESSLMLANVLLNLDETLTKE